MGYIQDVHTKYELLETPRRRYLWQMHSWSIFCLTILLICVTVVLVISIYNQAENIQQSETLDFILFGPQKETPDIIKVSEYRALTYALANSSIPIAIVYNETKKVGSYQHVEKSYSLVCYYVSPSRVGLSDAIGIINDPLLDAEKIDPNLCTHIIISFATVENNTLLANKNDYESFKTITSFKNINPKLKVLLSVVSFSTSDDNFGVMVSSKENRKIFISSTLEILEEHSFDGIDLDWEFPSWPEARNLTQKDQFSNLLIELREAFADKYILSVAVAAPYVIVKRAYDIDIMAKTVDFVNIMCYDFHSYIWYFPFTGLNAPLYATPYDKGYFATFNTNFSIYYWLSNGMPKEKLVIGMPTYGHSWTLLDAAAHNIGDPSIGFGSIGTKGFVTYKQICDFISRHDTSVVFEGDAASPYAYNNREWFSYDDEKSLAYKAELVTELGLAGAMVFSLNNDDFDGASCPIGTPFPLVNRVKSVLKDDYL